MPNPLFDREMKQRHMARALARAKAAGPNHALFLHEQIAQDMAERVQAFAARFERVAVLRDVGMNWRALLADKLADGARLDVRSPTPLADAELGFAPASHDLILAPLCLHWVDDLPTMLLALRLALKPGGVLIGALFGGESLVELKLSLAEAEERLAGGVHPRTSPVVDLRTLAALMQAAGFALPVADGDRVALRYASALKLMKELSDAGESNALAARARQPMSRALLMTTAERYHARFTDPDNLIPVTCDVLHFSGAAPG